ncbi:MAG: hypothetical protein KME25_34035 [Symplocastrum torsivum CPER-KK1]|jgi:hypothetical protein|uniref:Uncharacterized protein n=1 Tax=Symplocastrum torsivum CPER-KK1 TaxID=450513 RepID=A0A951UDD9_9CYAN|nr:hypothetical protein [Symplocastrum torsivum CPER-KK1]
MTDMDKLDKSVKGSNPNCSTLLGLEISKGELKHLTGLGLNNISLHKPSTFKRAISERRVALEILFAALSPVYFVIVSVFVVALTSLVLSNIDINLLIPAATLKDIGATTMIQILSITTYWIPTTIITIVFYLKIRQLLLNKIVIPKTTISLIEEVIKYNRIAKTVEVQQQLEAAGNPVILSNREKVIEALNLTRADLVRALKTERILRENKDIINSQPELFENNLAALKALDVSEQASESGQLLNETLQVAIGVQEEMKKLQD